MPNPKTPNDYHNLAKQRGLIWLGPDVPDKQTPANWRTLEGEAFGASFEEVAGGEFST